jgi:hypothetical protein
LRFDERRFAHLASCRKDGARALTRLVSELVTFQENNRPFRARRHLSAMTLPSEAGARAIMPKGHVITHIPHAMQACLPPTFVTTSSGERCMA